MTTEAQFSEEAGETGTTLGVKLELLSGPMGDLEFEITKEIVTIGREQNGIKKKESGWQLIPETPSTQRA